MSLLSLVRKVYSFPRRLHHDFRGQVVTLTRLGCLHMISPPSHVVSVPVPSRRRGSTVSDNGRSLAADLLSCLGAAIMTAFFRVGAFLGIRLAAFGRDAKAASAVEFAILSMPFIMLLMGILQMGIYYMAQSSLDAGVLRTAETLRNSFTTGTTLTLPTGASLKSQVATNGGGMIKNSSNLAVDIRQITNLSSAAVPIADQTTDFGSTTSTLVLRAQSSVVTFAPGFSILAQVRSSAIVRRQGT